MSDVLNMAKRYVFNYGWSVIPVKNKIPQVPSWSEYQKRLPTLEELQNWFSNPGTGIAIVTGALSGLTVIDVDGVSALKVSSPIVVKTPKGRHLYFKYQEGIKNHVRILENVDIRSEGGFVCAPCTSGYRFINPYFRRDNIPSFPVCILPSEEKQAVKNGTGWISDALKTLREGNRNAVFTKVVGRFHYDHYAPDDIIKILAPHANAVEFPLSELRTIVESVTRYENKKLAANTGISKSVSDFLSQESKVEWLVNNVFAKQSLNFIVGLPEALKTWAAMDLAIEISRGGKWMGNLQTNKSRVLFIDQERALPETQRRFKSLIAEKGLTEDATDGYLFIDCSSHRKMDLEPSFQSFKKELQEIKPDVVIVDSFVTFHTKDEKDRMAIQFILDRLKLLREEFGCSFIFINHENKMAYEDARENQEPSVGRMAGSVGVIAAPECVLTVKRINETTSAIYNTKNNLAKKMDSFMFSVLDTDKGIKIEAQHG